MSHVTIWGLYSGFLVINRCLPIYIFNYTVPSVARGYLQYTNSRVQRPLIDTRKKHKGFFCPWRLETFWHDRFVWWNNAVTIHLVSDCLRSSTTPLWLIFRPVMSEICSAWHSLRWGGGRNIWWPTELKMSKKMPHWWNCEVKIIMR